LFLLLLVLPDNSKERANRIITCYSARYINYQQNTGDEKCPGMDTASGTGKQETALKGSAAAAQGLK
jgi:hypothetical protein